MKNSGDENAFADANPFLGLDRSRFRDAEKNARSSEVFARAKKTVKRKNPDPSRPGKGKAADEDMSMSDLLGGPGNGPAAASADAPADETEIFMEAMGDEVKPLAGKGREVALRVTPKPVAAPNEPSLEELLEGKVEFAELHKGEYMEGHVLGLDNMIMQKLRAGSYSPEAHLDLHGLNAEQAFLSLREFFRMSWHKGVRMVLIVTGRGRNSPHGVGVLRDQMHLWLTREPLKRIVLAFCTAKPSDGGPGSIYVLLRKFRKKGKVYWDRLPPDAF